MSEQLQPLEIESPSQQKRVTIDDIVRAIPFGRFQVLMIMIFHLIYSAPSIVVYNYAFFLLYPQYLCKEGAQWVRCSRDQMCASQIMYMNRTMSMGDEEESVFESQVDWSDPYSLRNWITRLNLDCRGDAIIISLFGSYEFFGQLVACIVFPLLADLFGRRLFTFIGMGLQTFVFIGLIAFRKYQIVYLLIFLLGNAVIIRYLIAYAHLMEFVAQRQNLITGVFLFLDGLVYIYSPLFLVYVAKSTQYFVWIALGVSLVPVFLLGFVFHMPESLKYSLVKQDIMRFENDMDYICEMNKASEAERAAINELVERYCEQVHEDNKHKRVAATVQSAAKKQGRVVQLICRDRESFYNLGLMILCWVSNTFTYFLVIFLVKYLPGSLYMNQLVSGFSVIGYLVVPMLAPRFDNRRIMLVGYVLSIVFLFAMLFVEQGGIWSSTDELVYSLIFFLFKCGVSMVFISLFVIHQDLFTTKYLATSYGLCNTISRLLTLGAPLVAEIPNRAVPVAIMLVLNLIALVAAYYLRLKKPA